MKRYWFILAALFIPLAALALDSGVEIAAAGGDFDVAADLSTGFGRMAAAGDFLPEGEPGSGGGGYEQNFLLLGVGQ